MQILILESFLFVKATMATFFEMVEVIIETTVEESVEEVMEEGVETEVVQAVLTDVIDSENVNVEAETEVKPKKFSRFCLLKCEVLKQNDSFKELLLR